MEKLVLCYCEVVISFSIIIEREFWLQDSSYKRQPFCSTIQYRWKTYKLLNNHHFFSLIASITLEVNILLKNPKRGIIAWSADGCFLKEIVLVGFSKIIH